VSESMPHLAFTLSQHLNRLDYITLLYIVLLYSTVRWKFLNTDVMLT